MTLPLASGGDSSRSVLESGFVTSDPKEMVEILLGIPDVRVLDIVEGDDGMWVEIETTVPENCPSCRKPATETERRAVEMESRTPFFGRPFSLSWKTRGYRCENPGCPVGSFFEEAEWQFARESPRR